MTKIFFYTIILITLFYGCEHGSNKSTVEKPITSVEKPVTDVKLITDSKFSIICNFDSVTIAVFDKQIQKPINDRKLRDSSHLKIFSDNLIPKIRPYLKDSFLYKYSLFRNNVFAQLTVFDDGKVCENFYVVYNGNGRVAEEIDTTVAFLIPKHYQYRVKIPNKVWRQWMKELQ